MNQSIANPAAGPFPSPYNCIRSPVRRPVLILYPLLGLILLTISAPAQTESDSTIGGYISPLQGWQYSFNTHPSLTTEFPSSVPPDSPAYWQELTLRLRKSDLDSVRSAWLRLRLPKPPWKEAYIALPQNITVAFAVYLNGRLIYSNGDASGNASGALRGRQWHRIALPEGWQEKRVYFYLPEPVYESLNLESVVLASNMDLTDAVAQRITEIIREEMVYLVLGLIITAAGILSLFLSILQRRGERAAALLFGIVALEYGMRTILDTTTISLLFFNVPPIIWRYCSAFVTYSILIPFTLFVREFFGWGWKSSIRWMLAVECIFGIAALMYDGVTGIPYASHTPFVNILSILAMLVVLINMYLLRSRIVKDLRVLAAGYLILMVIVLLENALRGGLQLGGLNPEPIGFTILLISLAYVVVYRFIESDRQLYAIDQELTTARRIQSSILPKENPAIQGLSISTRYVPMASVAGDYYDFLRCGERAVGILVADVSGHGVPAAIIASMLKVALAAQDSNATDPAAVLRNMNRIFCGKLGREFITAAYAYIDIDNRLVVFSGAGHLPLLLFQRSSNSVVELHARGLFLGKMPEASYINERIQYSMGDRLFLFTDGIIEARNREGVEFGDPSFREFIIGQKDIPLELLADRLLERLAEWTGKKGAGALDDDVTLVVAEFVNT